MYVLHPAQIGLGEAVGHELGLALVDNVHSGLCERRHLDEPLRRGHRLNGRAAAVAGADVVLVVLDLNEVAAFLEVLNNRLAALIAVHTLVLAAVCVDGRVLVEHEDLLEVVALTHLEVVRVVARRNLDAAGAELHVDVLVAEDRDLTVHDREDAGLADQVLVALVVRVDRDAGIAHEGLRTGSCNDQIARAVCERVADVPQLARLGLVLNLGVGKRGRAVRTPVDDAVALVDQALVVQVYENFADRLGAALVHREALALPVTGRAELFQLADDAVAELVLPVPDTLQKFLAAEVITGLALLLAEVLLDLDLGCDAGVVGARHPQSLVALHALGADQDILKGLVERMAHMELAGYVRRRDNDGIGFLFRVDFGMEEAGVVPEAVQLVLDRFRVVGLRQFAHRSISFNFFTKIKQHAVQNRTKRAPWYHLNSRQKAARSLVRNVDRTEQLNTNQLPCSKATFFLLAEVLAPTAPSLNRRRRNTPLFHGIFSVLPCYYSRKHSFCQAGRTKNHTVLYL